MNITRENIDSLNGIIRVSIEKADYAANVEQSLADYRKKVNMPGFRPGKVPQGLVKKMYGKAALAEEVNKVLSEGLSKFIFDEKLDILGEPIPNEDLQKSIDWDNDADFEFVFDIGFAPEVKLTFDKKTKLTYYKIKVSDDMIDKQIESYAARFGANQPVDVVEKESTVRGNISQVDAENGLSAEMALISIGIIKDEEIQNSFIGKKIGDEVIFDIKKAYPNDTEIAYLLGIDKKDAAAVEGNFNIEIKEINKFVPAELNEEHYKKILGENTDVDNAETFRLHVADELSAYYNPTADYKFAVDTRDILVKKVKMDFPEAFLKRWLLATNKELTAEQIDADFEPFLEDLRWQVIKENVVKENELSVSEDDVLGLAKEVAASQFRQYGMFDLPEEHLEGFAKQMLEKKDDRNRLYNKKMEDKIMEVFKSKIPVEVKEVTSEEFEKMFEKN
jgi:trigger factor